MAETGFKGYNQDRGRTGQKGPIPQKRLVVVLRVLIDTSKSRASSRMRDDARATLRQLMETANWNTPYVLRNVGAKRCRYLRGLGYDVPIEDAMRSAIDRLEIWIERHG